MKISKLYTSALLLIFTLSTYVQAAKTSNVPRHLPSPQQLQEMQAHNQNALLSLKFNSLSTVNKDEEIFPYAEYNEAGYLIMSSEEDFGSAHIKEALVRNLPKGMTLIVYTEGYNVDSLYRKLQSYNENNNPIRILKLEDSDRGFWARDAVPVPVWKRTLLVPDAQFEFGVVDARYYHYFEPDDFINQYFKATMTSYNFYYEGGNFMANSKGDCLIVNKTATQIIPDAIFSTHYGCKTIVRLEHLVGIGHADEVVKFVADDHVFTDQAQYVPILESKGFNVTLLPMPKGNMWDGETYETYVNSLIVNDTVFVPIFGRSTDQEALDAYETLGLKVVALNSRSLSNDGAGSIHCITMTYPEGISYDALARSVGGQDVTPGSLSTGNEDEVESEQQQQSPVIETQDEQGRWDWLWSAKPKNTNAVKLASSQKNSMPNEDHHEGLETYERPSDEDPVGGFMEPDPRESETEDSLVLF